MAIYFFVILSSVPVAHAQQCTENTQVSFTSGQSELKGELFYSSNDVGAHSRIAVYLAGFPPAEHGSSTMLAKPICEAGWSVLYFHYRGTYSSPGRFSIANAIADAADAVTYLKATYAPEVLAVVGHSFGGLVALQVGARAESRFCVVASSAPNPAVMGANFAANPEAKSGWAEAFNSFVGPDKAVTSADGEAEAAYFVDQGAKLDITGQSEELSGQPLLLIGASRDTLVPVEAHHKPLVALLQNNKDAQLTELVMDADHNYTGRRQFLEAMVSSWLNGVCADL